MPNFATLEPPLGSRWARRVVYSDDVGGHHNSGLLAYPPQAVNYEAWRERFTELTEWARQNTVFLAPTTFRNLRTPHVERTISLRIPVSWEVIPPELASEESYNEGFIDSHPELHVLPSITSSCCNAVVTISNGGAQTCSLCGVGVVCRGCSASFIQTQGPSRMCASCNYRGREWYCHGCDGYYSIRPSYIEGNEEAPYCNACYQDTECGTCGQRSHSNLRDGCQACAQAEMERFRTGMIEIPVDQLPVDRMIPSLPERPFRTITIETEVDGNARTIGQALFACGMIDRPQLQSYSYNAPRTSTMPAVFKSDSSVGAGEILLPFMEFDRPDHVQAMMDLMQALQTLQSQESLSLSPHCGGHIHITAEGMSHHDVWRLALVYGFLEHTLYHIGGAGQENGHRTIQGVEPEYDEAGYPYDDHDYAMPVVKGPFNTLTNFGRRLAEQDRNTGLNLANYFKSLMDCRCGAGRMGQPQECTCELSKYTIEWRLWGSTLNPRILHAFISIMQAVTAFAENERIMQGEDEAEFPAFPWDRKHFPIPAPPAAPTHPLVRPQSDDPIIAQTKQRLEWMHTRLPLTAAERDSIGYACKQSELARLGDTYLDGLLLLENKSTVAPKRVRERRRIRNIAASQTPLPTVPSEPPVVDGARVEAAINNSPFLTALREEVNSSVVTEGPPIRLDYDPEPFNNQEG